MGYLVVLLHENYLCKGRIPVLCSLLYCHESTLECNYSMLPRCKWSITIITVETYYVRHTSAHKLSMQLVHVDMTVTLTISIRLMYDSINNNKTRFMYGSTCLHGSNVTSNCQRLYEMKWQQLVNNMLTE